MKFKVHHVGYAVPEIESAIVEFETLGWRIYGKVTDDVARKVRIQFLVQEGKFIELVAPLTDDSPIKKTLQKGSGTPYHICYEVDSLETAESELKKQRFIVFKKPMPAPAIGNRRVEWFFSKSNGIIELVEVEQQKG